MDNDYLTRKLFNFQFYIMQYLRENNRGPFSLEEKNRGQAQILTILQSNDGIAQRKLVGMLDMTPQSASEMIKKLETKKLIKRVKDESDKRVYIISLTTKGKVISRKLREIEPLPFDVLTDEEREQLSNILTKLSKDIEPRLKRKPRRPMF